MGKIFLGLVLGLVLVNNVFTQTFTESLSAGNAKYDVRDYAGALPMFKEALTLAMIDEEKMRALDRIGFTYLNMGDMDNAIIEFLKTWNLNGDIFQKAQSQMGLGGAYEFKGDYVNALTAYQRVKTIPNITPDLVGEAQNLKGGMYLRQKDYKNALIEYKKTFDITDIPIGRLRIAFKNIIMFQVEAIGLDILKAADWKSHLNWMTTVAIKMPSSTQEETDFAGEIISQRDKTKQVLEKAGILIP